MNRTVKPGTCFRTLSIAICLTVSAGVFHAQTNKKSTPAPAKPAPAPAKPASAPASHPSGGGGASSGTGAHAATSGPSIGGAKTNTGPSIGGSAARTGPTIGGTHPATSAGPTIGGARTSPTPAMGGRPGGVTPANVPHGMNSARGIPAGARPVSLKSGSSLVRRPGGGIRDVHDERRGINIHNGLHGERHISVERADHSRIYAERGRPGYIQRGYSFRGHDFERRAYFYHGRAYDRFYRGYEYRPGLRLSIYAPARYYRAGFYGWAYNPWYAPVVYPWGWAGNPWYGYYGFYFSPYPAYPTASLWLTDYMIAQDLQAQYQAQQEAHLAVAGYPAAGGPPALTPEVKQMIADEVRGQIALENAEAQQSSGGQEIDPASSSIARLMSDGHPHVFVAGGSLDLIDAAGAECAVSDGDALQLNAAPPPDSQVAQLTVLSSKGSAECQRGDKVNVALTDVQEMQNHMRERIDQGLEELQSKQGKSGLPAAPPSAVGGVQEAAYVQQAPPPEAGGPSAIDQQIAAADASQQEVVSQAQQEAAPGTFDPVPPPAAPAGPPPTVSLGQTIDQVKAAFGQPTTVIDLGAKKIYTYPGMKITFRAGKVADVQ